MSYAALALRFLAALILLSIVIAVMFYLLAVFADIEPNNGVGVSTLLLAALYCGHRWVETEGYTPSSGYSWLLSFYLTLVWMVFSGVLLMAVLAVDPTGLGQLSPDALPFIAGSVLVIGLLLIRLGFGLGVRSAGKKVAHHA